MKKEYISTIEAADFFKVSRPTMRKWIDKGSIDAYITPGGTARVSVKSLIKTMKKHSIPVPIDLLSMIAYRILVVDDQIEQTKMIKASLSDEKYVIETAINGYQACIKMGEFKPDIVILDIMMPLMNGVELYKEIKKNEILRTTKTIIITGYPESEEVKQLKELNVKPFLFKPFTPKQLNNEIENII